jgi:DNA-binding NarL/FixJ family response regulator
MARREASEQGQASDRVLERERELAVLDGLVEGAAAGRAQVGLVEGAAGIGKSLLLAELRSRAESEGFRVLAASGSELEREFPFGVVRQLFEPLLIDSGDRDRLLSGAASGARSVFETLEDTGADAVADASLAALHGLYWLTADIAASGPTLIAIDDLHWCDPPSLRFVAYLVRRLEGLPVIVAGTLRPSEPGADMSVLGEIAPAQSTVSIHPRPLSQAGVHTLVVDELGPGADEPFSAACHRATGGNPLLLRQLVRSLQADGIHPDAAHVDVVRDIGPRAVTRTVLVRLARLGEEAASVARAVAVLGESADLPTIAALAELDERHAAEAAGALGRAEILRPGSPFAFVHPLVRDAVYDELPVAERELQHARAASILSRAGAAPELVAAHLLLTSQRGEVWVVELLQEAGRAAQHKGAADSAAAYLRRALAEPPSPDRRMQVLLELGLAEALTNAPAAAEHLRQAYDELDDPVARAFVAHVLGRALLFSGSPREAAEFARRTAVELPPEHEDMRKALEAFELVATFFGSGEPKALSPLEQYAPPAEGDGAGAKMMAAVAALVCAYSGRPAGECAELALAALAGGELIAADNGLLSIAAILPLVLADRDEGLEALRSSLEDAHRRGSLFSLSSIHLWHGFTLCRRGELAEAEESLRLGLDEAELYGYGARAYFAAFPALVLIERGDTSGARQTLERGDHRSAGPDGARWWLVSRVRLLLAEDEAQGALDVAEALQEASRGVVNPAAAPWRSLKAQALDRLGRADEALALATEEVELARRFGAPGTVGRALRIVGTIEREDGLDHLREAVEVLRDSPAQLEHAKALGALGAALRRAGKRADAREPLREALDLAHRCGAHGLAERTREELVAAGAKPRREALSGVEALTPSELRVARMAAEGLTNREIAQSLFVTIRTVQGHLSQAFQKLGVESRAELERSLAAGGSGVVLSAWLTGALAPGGSLLWDRLTEALVQDGAAALLSAPV